MVAMKWLIDIDHSIPYAALAKVFKSIEATTKRLEKTAILTAFFLLVIQHSGKDHQSLLQAVYLCTNRVCRCPIHKGRCADRSLLVVS